MRLRVCKHKNAQQVANIPALGSLLVCCFLVRPAVTCLLAQACNYSKQLRGFCTTACKHNSPGQLSAAYLWGSCVACLVRPAVTCLLSRACNYPMQLRGSWYHSARQVPSITAMGSLLGVLHTLWMQQQQLRHMVLLCACACVSAAARVSSSHVGPNKQSAVQTCPNAKSFQPLVVSVPRLCLGVLLQVIVADTFTSLSRQYLGPDAWFSQRPVVVLTAGTLAMLMCFPRNLSALGACDAQQHQRPADAACT
jgi:hypothetical protein